VTDQEVPLRYLLLYRNKKVGSGWALPRSEGDRLWRNFWWSIERPTVDSSAYDVDLRCRVCGATWVGAPGESCDWCARRHENLIAGQRTLVLMEPEIDIDAHEKDLRLQMEAWQARLLVAIEAQLVTAGEADNVVQVWAEKVNQWCSTQPD
jgi:hypothetical protein